MWRLLLSLSVIGGFLFSSACVRQQNERNSLQEPIKNPGVQQQNVNSEKLSKIQEIKRLYLTLNDQLSQSEKQESQDLAKLAKAAGKASDEDVGAFLESGYPKMTEAALEEQGDKSIPLLLTDDKTKYAAISLISLGALAIGGGLLTFKPMRTRSYAALGIGIAGIIIGSKLLNNPSDENRESAQKLALSSGIIAVILGLGSVAVSSAAEILANDTEVLREFGPRLKEQYGNLPAIDQAINDVRKVGFDNLADIMMVARNDLVNQYTNLSFLKASADFAKRISDRGRHAKTAAEIFTEVFKKPYKNTDLFYMKESELKTLYEEALKMQPDKGGSQKKFSELADAISGLRIKVSDAPKSEDFPVLKINEGSAFGKRMSIGSAIAAIGAGFIVASQTAFNLTDTPSTPHETLQKINYLLATY